MSDPYAPTPKLRWVKRDTRPDDLRRRHERDGVTNLSALTLEQWWAPAVADYMRGSEGEWREVEVVVKP